MRKKKAATLTGSLLTPDKSDQSTGFVISLVDRLKEARTAAESEPAPPSRAPKEPVGGQPADTSPSVDIVDSIRPRSDQDEAQAVDALDRSGSTGTAPGTSAPRQASSTDQPTVEGIGSQAAQLVQVLRNGDLERAETIFGRMTGLSTGHVRRVLYGAEGRNLAIACRALDIDQLQFISIFMLSRRLGLGEKALEPRKLTHIASYFDQTDGAAARKTLNQWLCYSGD